MPSIYTLDEDLVEYLYNLSQKIENNQNLNSFDYDSLFKQLQIAVTVVESAYTRLTGSTLRETSRRLFDDTQGGGIETFINYYNGFLFIRKMQEKLRWRQKCGVSPK